MCFYPKNSFCLIDVNLGKLYGSDQKYSLLQNLFAFHLAGFFVNNGKSLVAD